MPDVLIDPFGFETALLRTGSKLAGALMAESEGTWGPSTFVYAKTVRSQRQLVIAKIDWLGGAYDQDVIDNVKALARLRFARFFVEEWDDA